MGAWDREAGAGPLRPARVPHAAAASARSGGRVARPTPRARPSTSTSTSCATPAAVADAPGRAHAAGAPVRDGSAVGRARRSPARCAPSRSPSGAPTTATARRLRRRRRARRPGGRATRSAALVAEGGPPLVAHRAKELMHGLDLDIRTLHHDTAVMAYLLDPGEGKYLLDDLALRFLALEVESPDAEPGTLDLDGDLERRADRPARRRRCCGSPASSSVALDAARAHRPLRAVRAAARAGAGPDGARRHPHRPRVPRRRCAHDLAQQCDALVAQDPRARGRGVQRELHAAAAHDPVREARAACR